MAYTDFIAVIDLGTSNLVGLVGKRYPNNKIAIIAYETEESTGSIRRGCIYNIDEAVNKTKRLINRLESKLNNEKIAKVYVGIGGQSLHTIDHRVSLTLNEDEVVTEQHLTQIYEECKAFQPELQEVYAITTPTFLLDDKQETNPVGVPCKQIEARYKLTVGRPSLKKHIHSVMSKLKIEVADILVSPLALADVVTSENERSLGCALINFGAGVTSFAIFKNNLLVDLSVIPLGGNLITRDITSLHIIESEAERLKITHGSAIAKREEETTVSMSAADGVGTREIKLADINLVIEARAREIIENIAVRIEETGIAKELGAGIIIAGGASALKALPELLEERSGLTVRLASVRKGLIENERTFTSRSENAVAIGLISQGKENCAAKKEEPIVQSTIFGEDDVEVVTPPPKQPKQPKEAKKSNFFDRIKKGVDKMSDNLFNDEDE
ncbi:cell division protein FtsA [Parabacteroides sp. OttesenSCG-928-N08]|nr:cell division protein FtsA [Parabacteroides sp. OttesenSCG-928-N08]